MAGILAGLLFSQPITKHAINMAGKVSITFVYESKDFHVEKSGKSRHLRPKWLWLAAFESGSDVDPTETDSESGSEVSSTARETSEHSPWRDYGLKQQVKMNRMKGTQAQSQCLAQVPLVKVMKKTMDVTLKPMNNQMNKHE